MNKSALPETWELPTLGEIIDTSTERVDPTGSINLPFVGLEHIEKDTGHLLGHGNSKDVRSTKTRFHEGDLLYGKLRPYLNKVHVAEMEGVCSTDILVYPKNRNVSTRYLSFCFLQKKFVEYTTQNMKGVQHPRIDSKSLSAFRIPLPPLADQKRIVAKIEELFSNLDAGVGALEKVRVELKRYRQAVLKAAFEGKLTKKWRDQSNTTESSEDLFEKLKKVKNTKTLEELRVRIEKKNLPILPKGWVWATTGMLSKFVTSGSRDWKKYYSKNGAIFIRTQNINKNRLDLSDVAYVSLPNKVEGKRSLVERGDILITITGANVGKVAIVEGGIDEAYVSQSVALVKLVLPELAKYVYYGLLAPSFGKTEIDKMVYGMGRPVLNLKNVQDVVLPIAPLREQDQLIEEIERRISVADEIEKTIDHNLKQTEKLRQSILKKAFDGRLVPQDPNDEPASVLLERIKAEKMKAVTVTKKRGKKNA